jgi:hypothetical protein
MSMIVLLPSFIWIGVILSRIAVALEAIVVLKNEEQGWKRL